MKNAITGRNILLLLAGCLTVTLGGCYVYSDQPPLPPVLIVPAGNVQPVQTTTPTQPPVYQPPAPVGAPSGEVGPIR